MSANEMISIIVPVYNVAAYLPQCLDSILGQTYRELEIICVNDGSKDRSLELLERYAHKDNRVKVLDKANEGVSRARNDALVVAQGEYVMFVDADDWIDSETCQLAIDAINTHQADVVLWSYVSENKGSQSFKKLFDGDAVFDEDDSRMRLHRRFIGIIGEELTHPELADSLGPVWGKLYKRNVIQQSGAKFVDLSEIGTYEDGLFNLEVFGEVKRAVYIDKCLYHYRKDNAGSTTTKYNPNLFNEWQNLYERMAHYIREHNLPVVYEQALSNRRALGILGLGLNILSSDWSLRKQVSMIRGILTNQCYVEAYRKIDCRFFPFHWKVFYGCAKYKCSVGVALMLMAIRMIISK